jgi:hypothetical protein
MAAAGAAAVATANAIEAPELLVRVNMEGLFRISIVELAEPVSSRSVGVLE